MRPPATRGATVGMTDSPALVQSSRKAVRYVASVWVRANSTAYRSGQPVRLSLGQMSPHGLGVHAWAGAQLRNGAWRQVSVPFTARADGRALDVTVRAQGVPRGGAVLVDDVVVRRVSRPEASDRVLRGVRFGASVDEGPLDWSYALRLSDRRYSRMEVVRYFEPMIRDVWSGHLGRTRRSSSVSFTAPPGRVISGDYDGALRQWFRDAPRRYPIWWTYWHEPEDDIANGAISARNYRRAWRHINAIANQVGGRNLHPTLVLMAWTANPMSGRSVNRYYPGSFIDVVAWDGYNPPGWRRYARPAATFGHAVAKSNRLGDRFAIAELGSVLVPGDDGSRRASWLVDVARYSAQHNAAFVSYWDAKIPGENYQLRDLPSRLAWRSVVRD